MEIRLRNGILTVADVEIGIRDGLYSLSDVSDVFQSLQIYARPMSSMMQRKGFLSKLSKIIGKDMSRTPNPIRDLKRLGVYRTYGRRAEMRTYCSLPILIAILMEYGDCSFCAILDDYLKK